MAFWGSLFMVVKHHEFHNTFCLLIIVLITILGGSERLIQPKGRAGNQNQKVFCYQNIKMEGLMLNSVKQKWLYKNIFSTFAFYI